MADFDEQFSLCYQKWMTPEQCRAGRAWLSWSQTELAGRATLALATVKDYETGKRTPHPNNLKAIRVALESGGISFLDGAPLGITFSKPVIDGEKPQLAGRPDSADGTK
jgi:transcriptional regulator with XRE-family HTH domain